MNEYEIYYEETRCEDPYTGYAWVKADSEKEAKRIFEEDNHGRIALWAARVK